MGASSLLPRRGSALGREKTQVWGHGGWVVAQCLKGGTGAAPASLTSASGRGSERFPARGGPVRAARGNGEAPTCPTTLVPPSPCRSWASSRG